MSGIKGRIIEKLFNDVSAEFKMFPFSTDSLYNTLDITSDDGSGVKHISKNGNIWLTCNCPDEQGRYVEVTLTT